MSEIFQIQGNHYSQCIYWAIPDATNFLYIESYTTGLRVTGLCIQLLYRKLELVYWAVFM